MRISGDVRLRPGFGVRQVYATTEATANIRRPEGRVGVGARLAGAGPFVYSMRDADAQSVPEPNWIANTSGWVWVPAAGDSGGDVQVLRLSPKAKMVSPTLFVAPMYSPMS